MGVVGARLASLSLALAGDLEQYVVDHRPLRGIDIFELLANGREPCHGLLEPSRGRHGGPDLPVCSAGDRLICSGGQDREGCMGWGCEKDRSYPRRRVLARIDALNALLVVCSSELNAAELLPKFGVALGGDCLVG